MRKQSLSPAEKPAQTPAQNLAEISRTVRPVKHRVALVPVKEEMTGIIVIPSNANQVHRLGVVTSIGDSVDIDVKVTDVVIYQVNKMFEMSVTHLVGEAQTPVMIMHQGDAFAKLEGRAITIDKFTILGDWILAIDIKLEMMGGLFLPDSAVPPPEFEVIQLGNMIAKSDDPVIANLKIGDRVYFDKSRCNQIRIEGKTYFYILKAGLHGVRTPE